MPLGCPVIQTSSQYKYYKEREDEINNKYRNQLLKKEKHKVLSLKTIRKQREYQEIRDIVGYARRYLVI